MCTGGTKDSKPVQGLGLTVTWTGLGLTVKEKVCLAPCNGTLRAGSLNALMGPTGAGKTTLLATVAGLLKPSSGKILLGDDDITDDVCAFLHGFFTRQTYLFVFVACLDFMN